MKVVNIRLAARRKATIPVKVSRQVVGRGAHFHLCRLERVVKLLPRAPYDPHSIRSENTRSCYDNIIMFTKTIGSTEYIKRMMYIEHSFAHTHAHVHANFRKHAHT